MQIKLNLPSEVPYVIIGAGTAAHAACRAIQKREPNAKVICLDLSFLLDNKFFY